jgi:hypothetical protein
MRVHVRTLLTDNSRFIAQGIALAQALAGSAVLPGNATPQCAPSACADSKISALRLNACLPVWRCFQTGGGVKEVSWVVPACWGLTEGSRPNNSLY